MSKPKDDNAYLLLERFHRMMEFSDGDFESFMELLKAEPDPIYSEFADWLRVGREGGCKA